MPDTDDSGLIKLYIPILSGKRSTRVKLPGDCTLVDARLGPLSQPVAHRGPDGYLHVKRKATGGRPQVELTMRLVERYEEPVERLFRVVRIEEASEHQSGRSLGTLAQIAGLDGQPAWELIEIGRWDRGTRISDIKTMRMARGLNRLAFKNCVVVRVNGCELASDQLCMRQADGLFYPADSQGRPDLDKPGIMLGGQRRKPSHAQAMRTPLQWELRYQTVRKRGGMIGWSYIGTSADLDHVPLTLRQGELREDGAWRELRPGLMLWLSKNLLEVAGATG